jgi:peptidoglycan/xylan/chitin deacetylase (PgdA/CDA1 family)
MRKKEDIHMKYCFLRFPEGKTKAVTFSYDDGGKNDIRFLEIINQYGLKCTFNLIGKFVEDEAILSNEFIRENILSKGHEVAAHGYDHRAQDKIRSIEGIREIIDCRIALENAFGVIVRGMAFPDNVVNRFKEPEAYKRIKGYLSDLEVDYVRSADGDNDEFQLPEDWHNWIPTAHHNNPKIMEYIQKFVELNVQGQYKSRRAPRLFYMWGHSAEFENNQNWDHLEKICSALSGDENVWYATNMEIYEYVSAYRSLSYSADGTIIYNPTLIKIWFDVDGVPYCIAPGETLKL